MVSGGIASGSPAAAREERVLHGFLSRVLVDREASDLERISTSYPRLPENLVITDRIPADLIGALGQAEQIPVLDLSGEQIQVWTSSEFLAAFSGYQSQIKTRAAARAPVANEEVVGQSGEGPAPGADSSGGDWLSRLVLGGFPHPLFASDLQGKTLFYNEAFEAVVLAQPGLKNSIRLAENYFLELTRELLARSLGKSADRRMPLRTRLPDMHLALEVATLELEGRVMGYLYVFRDLVWTGMQYELMDMLAGGMGLDDVVDEIEGALIYQVLKDQGQNVSHAAQALKVKRSTLQNKIKRLKIDEKYDRKIEGPIRRRRRPQEDAAEDPPPRKAPAPSKKAAGKKASPAKKKASASAKKPAKKPRPAKKKAARKGRKK